MKKRITLILIAVLLVTAFALTFTACDKAVIDPGTGETTYTMDFATVYAMAEEAGYQGTMEDLIREFKGEAGTGISKIEKVGTEGLVDTYKITFTDGNSLNFKVTNGAEGAPGQAGPVGPAGPQGPQGPQGTPGAAGAAGRGISKIEKIASEGLVDTYKITFTNNTEFTFDVTNGASGENGVTPHIGDDDHWYIGEVDTGVVAIGANGANGVTPHIGEDNHWYIGEVDTGIVAAGTNGTNGITPHIGDDDHWYIGEVDTGVVAIGTNGTNGVGIASVEKTGSEGLVDTYTITLTNGDTYDFTVTNGKDGKDAVLPEFDPDGATPYAYFDFNLLSNNTYEISARYQNMPSRLVIPAVYEGKAVSEIAEGAFRGRTSITEVVIPTSIVSLHRHAFEDCTNLKIVTFEEGSLLTSIGSLDAFARCPIEIATIPSLADTAVGNDAIKTVKYIMNGGSYHVTMTGDHAFENCKNLTSVTFAADTKMIGAATFKNCPALTSVVIPVGTTIICDEAFMGTGLTWISLPDSVTTIGDGAFSACCSLSSAYLSSGLTEIPDRLFAYCSSLMSANIPAGVTSIGDFAFFDCDLYSCTIPAGMTSIGSGAFNGCNRLVFVCNLSSLPIEKGSLAYGGIGSNVIDLYTEAGSYPNSAMLSNYFVVRIEDEETLLIGYIGNQEIVWIPDEVTAINKNAFFGNDTIKQVHIGKNVKSIGKTAFCGCDNLTTVTIEKGLTKIDTQAFFDCANLTSIVIPSTVTSISTSAFMKCTSLVSIIVAEGNDTYYSEGNCVIERNTLRVICGCKTSVIPEDAKRIWWYSFEDCLGLYSVSIPDSVMSISQSAFRQCRDLVEVKIGSGVTVIDARAFEYCTSLRAIAIPVNVKVIAENAFAHCDLFTDIYYKGTKAEWAKVDVDESAIDSEVIIHCSDGIYGEE